MAVTVAAFGVATVIGKRHFAWHFPVTFRWLCGVSICCEAQRLYIRIVNPAPSPQRLAAGAGHAQASIAHRLGYRFGPDARMTGFWSGGYYSCDIVLPLI